MTNEEKSFKIAKSFVSKRIENTASKILTLQIESACKQMAQWKDEQYKTAYVVTRSEEHCDYVEKVFFDKEKAEEYCKPFNEDENSYHRDITEIEVSL